MQSIEVMGRFLPPAKKIAMVASRFNESIVEKLLKGAKETLIRHQVAENSIECFWVPGAFEIPLMCQQVAKTNQYSGIIALGAVIRGDTAHFDYVAGACANGVTTVQLNTNVPITFGVITTENLEQAIQRAGTTAGNKGAEAAVALLEQMDVMRQIND